VREDPLGHAEGQGKPAAARAEVRIFQADRVVGREPHIDQPRVLQLPPALSLAGQRDRALLGVSAAVIMITMLRDLAVAVVFAGKRDPVRSPAQQAALGHQHRRMPRPGMGITGQLRRPLHHLLRYLAVLAVQGPPLGLWTRWHVISLAAEHLWRSS